jgi:hypothetical protein
MHPINGARKGCSLRIIRETEFQKGLKIITDGMIHKCGIDLSSKLLHLNRRSSYPKENSTKLHFRVSKFIHNRYTMNKGTTATAA